MVTDLDVRANSFNSNMISRHEHEQWFTAKLDCAECCMFIALNAAGDAVGQIRVDLSDNVGIITLSVAAAHRGHGCGTEMLKEIIKLFEEGWFGVCRIIGRVKASNKVSQKAFLKVGFIEKVHGDFYEYWYPSEGDGNGND